MSNTRRGRFGYETQPAPQKAKYDDLPSREYEIILSFPNTEKQHISINRDISIGDVREAINTSGLAEYVMADDDGYYHIIYGIDFLEDTDTIGKVGIPRNGTLTILPSAPLTIQVFGIDYIMRDYDVYHDTMIEDIICQCKSDSNVPDGKKAHLYFGTSALWGKHTIYASRIKEHDQLRLLLERRGG